jgi:hypothetical protein
MEISKRLAKVFVISVLGFDGLNGRNGLLKLRGYFKSLPG